MSRVCIIGLDCLAPQLVFERYWQFLPNLRGLATAGLYGPLRSCHPPITVPAWACMVTGVDPGTLGVYGFRGRADHSYTRRRLASSLSYATPPLWTLLSRANRSCRILSVPQTYPPKPLKGCLVAGFPTPDEEDLFTYPAHLKDEVQDISGGYINDVPNFRTADRDALRTAIHTMTERRFKVARHWVAHNDWELFMMVEMGPDRMHHAFWQDDASLRAYYTALDREVGELVALLRDDDLVMVVSDHGAQDLHGALALNQWLLQRGDLVLHGDPPPSPQPLDLARVDWQRTRAWADGGYVGRIYLNVQGREPQGCIAPGAATTVADELAQALRDLPGPEGDTLCTKVFRPHALYRETRGIPPDLTVYVDGLRYRAVGSIGHAGIYLPGNDTGPDGANHAMDGVLIMGHRGLAEPPSGFGPVDCRGETSETASNGPRTGHTLFDIAPTVLRHLALPIPGYMVGKPIG